MFRKKKSFRSSRTQTINDRKTYSIVVFILSIDDPGAVVSPVIIVFTRPFLVIVQSTFTELSGPSAVTVPEWYP